MTETLLSIVTDYSIERTGHPRQRMEKMFAEHRDNCINYILRSVLPVEYCYDGIKHTFSRVETDNSVQLTCVFWYLKDDGRSLNTALRFAAKVEGDDIEYRFSLVPAREFPLHKELRSDPERLMGVLVQNYRWTKWTTGFLRNH